MKTGGNVQIYVNDVLLDTGASSSDYVTTKWLEQQRQKGYNFKSYKVDVAVTLGDAKTKISIKEKVEIPITFTDPDHNDSFTANVLCSVLESNDVQAPVIIGLVSIGKHFTTIAFRMLLRNAEQYKQNKEHEAYIESLSPLNLYLPWSTPNIAIAPEELDSHVPSSFGDVLMYLTTSRDEAIRKHNELVDEHVSPEFKKHCPGITDYLKSEEVLQTFLPDSWKGFTNIQAVGANSNDEIEIDFLDNFPTSMPVQPRHIPERLKGVAIDELQRLDTYLYRISNSSVASPLVIAPKATAPFIRIAGDYREVNKYVRINQEYIPRAYDEVMKCRNFRIYIDMDMTNSFHQIRLAALSSARLAVSTYIGLREPLFLPEGVSSGSMLLQKIVQYIFRDIRDHSIILFDNFLLLAHNFDDALVKLKNFFRICRQHNVILKMAKSWIGFFEVSFFGYQIKDHTISLAQSRKDAIAQIAFPSNKKLAQSFLGASIFFKNFVKNFSEVASSISKMTSDKFNFDPVTWDENYIGKFEHFKQCLMDSCTIHFPDYNLTWTLRTDGSNIAVGGMLFQTTLDGEHQPIAFASMKLSETASKWDIHKIECFAIYFSVKKMEHFLMGKQFIIETDHANLQFMEKSQFSIVIRWRCYLQQFACVIHHIKGVDNKVADYLSRMQVNIDKNRVLNDLTTPTDVIARLYLMIAQESSNATPLMNVVLKGPITTTVAIRPYATLASVFDAYLMTLIVSRDIPLNGYRFFAKGVELIPSQTLTDARLKDKDVIKVIEREIIVPQLFPVEDSVVDEPVLHMLSETWDDSVVTRTCARVDDLDSESLGQDTNPSEVVQEIQDLTETYLLDQNATLEEIRLSDKHLYLPEEWISMLLEHFRIVNTHYELSNYVRYLGWSTNTTRSEHERTFIKIIRKLQNLLQLPTLDIHDIRVLNRTLYLLPHVETQGWHRPDATGPDMFERMPVHCSLMHDFDEEVDVRFYASRTLLMFDLADGEWRSETFTHQNFATPFQFDPELYGDMVRVNKLADPWMCLTTPSTCRDILLPINYNDMDSLATVIRWRASANQDLPAGKHCCYILPTLIRHGPLTYVYEWMLSAIEQLNQLLPFTHQVRNVVHMRAFLNGKALRICSTFQHYVRKAHDVFDIMLVLEDFVDLTPISPSIDQPHTCHQYISVAFQTPFQDRQQLVRRARNSGAPEIQYSFAQYSTLADATLFEFATRFKTYHFSRWPNIMDTTLYSLYRIDDIDYTDSHRYTTRHQSLIVERDWYQPLFTINFPYQGVYPNYHNRTVYMHFLTPTLKRMRAAADVYSNDDDNVKRRLYDVKLYHTKEDKDHSIDKYDFELRDDNITNTSCFYFRNTSIKSTMDFWKATLPERMLMTQGPPKLRRQERLAMQTQRRSNSVHFQPSKGPELTDIDLAIMIEATNLNANTSYIDTPQRYTVLTRSKHQTQVDTTPVVTEVLDVDVIQPPTSLSSDGDEEGGQCVTEDEISQANDLVNQEMIRLHSGDKRRFHESARTMYFKCKAQWPNNGIPFRFFNDFVLNCAFCQKTKARMALRFQRLVKTLKNPARRRSAIGIDVLFVGHEDDRGNTLVIIIVQFFTRHVYAYPTNTYSAETVVDCLMSYYSIFGIYDIMASDPGSNLLAEVVRSFNEACNVEHKISLVDEHGSSGVENQGCKKIINHLQHLVAHESCIKCWSSPTVLGYAVMKINDTFSSEIGTTPFIALYGEPDLAWLECVRAPFTYPINASKYIVELWNRQKIITERAMQWQKDLHDKRVAKTPINLQKRYSPGDMVLRFRDTVIKTDKLRRLRYLGPFVVTRHDVNSNFVHCYHASNKKDKVFPVDVLVLFTGTEQEASKISQMDDDSYVLMEVLFHRGNPEMRTSLEFLVRFEDDDIPFWRPYDADLGSTEQLLKYCLSKPELSLLNRTAEEAKNFLVAINREKIVEVECGDEVYLDIRQWDYKTNLRLFNNLNLEYKDSKTYVVKAKYRRLSANGRKINLYVPIFNESYDRDHKFVYLYGRVKVLDDKMILVDENFIEKYPKILGQW